MENITLFNFQASDAEIKNNFLKGGQVHKKVIKDVLPQIQENQKLIDIAKLIENSIHKHTKFVDTPEQRLEKGIGFPIGLSINECAAHWTPNPLDTKISLGKDDLLKIDYGIHYQGCIVDGAYSFSLNPKFQELISVAEEATKLAIGCSGADAILGEIGETVQEYIESQEVDIGGKIYPLKSLKDLTGHKIMPWIIHADKCVPNFKCNYPVRMEAGEIYAIETFPTTGRGRGQEQNECSHYQVNTDLLVKEYRELNNINCLTGGKIVNPIHLDKKEKYVYQRILDLYQTLPFCKRWLSEENVNTYQIPLRNLVKKKRILSFPPINDIPGSWVAQSEKTILIGEDKVKVLN